MMVALSNFHFIRPEWFFAVPLAIGLWVMWNRHADPLRGWRAQMDPEFIEALAVGGGATQSHTSLWILTGWILALVALAGPTWQLEPSPFADDATPLMVVLKADISMDQTDPPPSRIERAQLKITDLAAARKGLPLGLMAYAGSAHLVLPPTRDTEVVADMASEISSEIMPVKGDRLDLALLEASRILEEGGVGGSILVVADAVDTDPAMLAPVAKDLAFPVQFLAMASPNSTENASLLAAADILRADVEPLDVEGRDITAIVRRASRTPVAQEGEESGQWQEAGYGLVPLLALMVLLSFRREEKTEAAT